MPHWIDIPAYTLAVIVSIPIAVLCLECLAALFSRRPTNNPDTKSRPPLAILIPAHNEQTGLPATLTSITPQLLPHDRILVVADNCTDATADVARQFPQTTVLERQDPLHRGKGNALDHGIRHLDS
ncbi:MAG TPA: glycosyltransferase, partial [Tepidisphaeraceae bacterium]|nr:glycosyltransferase [Tepidisphaeraceae bacterium]